MAEFLIQIGAEYRSVWLTLHLFAMVLGLGGATYSDLLLAHFLKDLRISKKEAQVIHTMARVVMIGIVLAFISGLFLFLPEADRLLQTPKFIVKCVAFIILTVNGFLLHHLVLPKLIDFSFHKDVYLGKNIIQIRHLGFIMGAISFVSWYTVFLLGSFKNIPFTLNELMSAYIIVLLGAVLISLLIERHIGRRIRKK